MTFPHLFRMTTGAVIVEVMSRDHVRQVPWSSTCHLSLLAHILVSLVLAISLTILSCGFLTLGVEIRL